MSHDGGMWVRIERSGKFWMVVQREKKWYKVNNVQNLMKRGHDICGSVYNEREP